MTKYPNSECEAHRDVKTSQPVCIICMGNEIEQLRGLLEAEQADCQLQRKNKNANWEKALRFEIAMDSLLNVDSYELRKQIIDRAHAESV